MDDLISNISQLDKLSDDQLKQYANNPNSPLGIYALSILQNRAIMRNQAQAAGAQQPQPTVRDSITASLPENTGIAAALGDQPVFTAAEGGIVAFGQGDRVFGRELTQAEYDALSTDEKIAYNRQRSINRKGVDAQNFQLSSQDQGLMRVLTSPMVTFNKEGLSDWKKNILEFHNPLEEYSPRAKQILNNPVMEFDKRGLTDMSQPVVRFNNPFNTDMIPYSEVRKRERAYDKAPQKSDAEIINEMTNPSREPVVRPGYTPMAEKDVAGPLKGTERPSTSVISPTAPTAGLDSLYTDIPFNEAAYDKYATPVKELSAYAKEYSDILGEDKGLAALKAKSDQMGANIEKQKELAPWMAAMRFGLGMAAGKSPFALQNLAEGGIEGMKDYANAIADYNKAQERKFDIDARLASAERSERVNALKYGQDSRQADQANQRAIGLAKLSDKTNVDLRNAANKLQAKEFVIEDQRKRDELKLTEQHYKDWYNVSLKNAEKALQGIEKQGIQQQTQILNNALDETNRDIIEARKLGDEATVIANTAKREAIEKRLFAITGVTYTPPSAGGALVKDKSGKLIYQPQPKQ
jgi:hypothetical protein